MAKADMTVEIEVKKVAWNKRRWLMFIYIPLLLTEWVIDTIGRIYNAFHKSVEEMILSLQTYINEPTSQASESSK